MGAYSALVLAANRGVRRLKPKDLNALCEELELIPPDRRHLEFDNLSRDITALFRDDEARKENEWFFCPDSICAMRNIQIMSPEEDYDYAGYCVRIHGNGYLFPWGVEELRSRVVSHPKLVRLRDELQSRFGGRFQVPWWKKMAHSRVIAGEGGWMWFVSESL
jgi:hypothetical protein